MAAHGFPSRPAAGGHASRSGHLHDIREAAANTPFPRGVPGDWSRPTRIGRAARIGGVTLAALLGIGTATAGTTSGIALADRLLRGQFRIGDTVLGVDVRQAGTYGPADFAGSVKADQSVPRRGSVRLEAQACRSDPQGQGGYRHASDGTEPTVRSGSGGAAKRGSHCGQRWGTGC